MLGLLGVLLAIVLGVAIIGFALKLLWWAVIGLVIGALARLVLPGEQAIGWLGTIGSGIAGAIVGGIIAHAFDWGGIGPFLIALGVGTALIAILSGSRRAYA